MVPVELARAEASCCDGASKMPDTPDPDRSISEWERNLSQQSLLPLNEWPSHDVEVEDSMIEWECSLSTSQQEAIESASLTLYEPPPPSSGQTGTSGAATGCDNGGGGGDGGGSEGGGGTAAAAADACMIFPDAAHEVDATARATVVTVLGPNGGRADGARERDSELGRGSRGAESIAMELSHSPAPGRMAPGTHDAGASRTSMDASPAPRLSPPLARQPWVQGHERSLPAPPGTSAVPPTTSSHGGAHGTNDAGEPHNPAHAASFPSAPRSLHPQVRRQLCVVGCRPGARVADREEGRRGGSKAVSTSDVVLRHLTRSRAFPCRTTAPRRAAPPRSFVPCPR